MAAMFRPAGLLADDIVDIGRSIANAAGELRRRGPANGGHAPYSNKPQRRQIEIAI
jgi:hypoxanthine-guanine phosphoribosyltransferase